MNGTDRAYIEALMQLARQMARVSSQLERIAGLLEKKEDHRHPDPWEAMLDEVKEAIGVKQ